jgi:hypothetical protein
MALQVILASVCVVKKVFDFNLGRDLNSLREHAPLPSLLLFFWLYAELLRARSIPVWKCAVLLFASLILFFLTIFALPGY